MIGITENLYVRIALDVHAIHSHKFSRTASLFVSCRHRELLRAWHRLYGSQHQNVPAKALYRVGLTAHTAHLLMDL